MDYDPQIVAQAKIAVASFFGGTVRLFLRPVATLQRSIFLVFCCVVCGYYFTPVVANILGVSDAYSDAVAALIGLIGLSVAEALINIEWGNIVKFWIRQPKE